MEYFQVNNKGFTTIELIITTVILGIIGVFSFQFITSGVESYIAVSAGEDVAREARLALERMAREVRTATNIVSPAAGDPPGSTITLDRTQGASTDNSTQVTFQLTSGTLERKRGSNTPEPLASNVSNFAVERSLSLDPDGKLITLDLTLWVSGQEPVQQRTMVYPRYFKYK